MNHIEDFIGEKDDYVRLIKQENFDNEVFRRFLGNEVISGNFQCRIGLFRLTLWIHFDNLLILLALNEEEC